MCRRRVDIPNHHDTYDRLDRPPWRCYSSVELADFLAIPIQSLWNWQLKRTGPPTEPSDLHFRVSNRRFYMAATVLEWLSAQNGEPIPARTWLTRYLADRYNASEDVLSDPAQLKSSILRLDQLRWPQKKWKTHTPVLARRLNELLYAKNAEIAA